MNETIGNGPATPKPEATGEPVSFMGRYLPSLVNFTVFSAILIFCTLYATEKVEKKRDGYFRQIIASQPQAATVLPERTVFKIFGQVRGGMNILGSFGYLPLVSVLGLGLVLILLPQRLPGSRTEKFGYFSSLGAMIAAILILLFHALVTLLVT